MGIINFNRELFRRAILIRCFEEKLLELFSQGRLSGTVHTCIGQEFSALAVINQLKEGDWIFSNHRCHGHYLAWNEDVSGLMAEIMGKDSGICGGRGGSQHICSGQFLSNGVQGGGVPIAAGCALALSRQDKVNSITAAFIGDWTLGQGVVYESLNLASLWNAPLLLVLEHNGYAQSTDTRKTFAGDVRMRSESFGVNYWEGSIWDLPALFKTAKAAADYVRNERKPALLRIECYRLKAHSKGDDNRDAQEIAASNHRDPLAVFAREFPEPAKEIFSQCESLVSSVAVALEKETAPAMLNPAGALAGVPPSVAPQKWVEVAPLLQPARVLERLRSGLRSLLAKDERVFLLGEDIEDPYGGAFKVTKGLSMEFPGRVNNTPISEAAIVGFGNGLALGGLRPVVEIMFGDFVTLAADQIINQASKFDYMYKHQVSVPVIIRAAMGANVVMVRPTAKVWNGISLGRRDCISPPSMPCSTRRNC